MLRVKNNSRLQTSSYQHCDCRSSLLTLAIYFCLCQFIVCILFSVAIADNVFYTPIGPGVAGQIHALAYDPDDFDIVYVGGDVGSVLRTLDGGLSWETWSEGLASKDRTNTHYVDDLIVIEDVIPSLCGVYAATRGGIYFRQKWGASWELLTERNNYSHNGGIHGDFGRPIPFSNLSYDSQNNILYAGAGNARWYADDAPVPYMYPELEPVDFSPFGNSPDGQYSLWKLNLSVVGNEWQQIPETENKGRVRQIATATYGGYTYITFSTPDGIFINTHDGIQYSEPWANLENNDKNLPGGFSWSYETWGVAFGSDNYLYALLRRGSDPAHVPGVYNIEVVGTDFSNWVWEWVDEEGGDNNIPPHDSAYGFLDQNWLQIVDDPNVDFTSITIRPHPSSGFDEIYIGERHSTLLGGIYKFSPYDDGRLDPTTGWQHILFIQPGGHWDSFIYRFLDARPYPWTISTLDMGWLTNYQINPTVPLTYHPEYPDQMIAYLYHVPLNTTDGGLTWDQVYSDGDDINGWRSRGLNEGGARSFNFLSDGRLLAGFVDFGLFMASTGSLNEEFTWLSWCHDSSNKSVLDIEVRSDMIYAIKERPNRGALFGYPVYPDERVIYVIGKRDPEVDIDDCPTWEFITTPSGNNNIYPVVVALTNSTDSEFIMTDMEFYDDNNIYVTCNTRDPGQHWKAHVLRGYFSGNAWSWSVVHGPEDQRFTALKRIPDSSRFLVAAEQSGGGVQGGIRSFDAEDPGVWEVWLQGGSPGDNFLEKAARIVNKIAVSDDGHYAYFGTRGVSYTPEQPGGPISIGTVLRLEEPFDTVPEEWRWEKLANENEDTFEFYQNFYHSSAGDWVWDDLETGRRMTEVWSLAVDPNDPTIIYAGIGGSFNNPSNGVWRFINGNWEQIVGQDDTPDKEVRALAFDPNDDSILYVGVKGEELFKATVPVNAPASDVEYDDVPKSVTKLNYVGTPYSSVTFDYNNDGLKDLMISIQDAESHLYKLLQVQPSGEPEFENVTEIAFPQNPPQLGLRGLAVADYDNDGYLDFFAAAETNARLYHNNGESFGDSAGVVGLTDSALKSWCGAWGDYDRDGQADLFIGTANHHGSGHNPENFDPIQDYLMRNNLLGSDQFEDKSNDADLTTNHIACLSASWADIELDGDLDLFIGSIENHSIIGKSSSRLMINQDDGTFDLITDLSVSFPFADEIQNISGVAWADFNNDGKIDLTLSTQSTDHINPRVFINSDYGNFALLTSLLTNSESSGLRTFDHDLDGWIDILYLPYQETSRPWLFTNNIGYLGNLFRDETINLGLKHVGQVDGATVADFTGDGDIDIYFGRPSVTDKTFYRATMGPGIDPPEFDWVGLKLLPDSDANNQAAIGTQVTFNVGSPLTFHQYQVVDGGSGRGGQNDLLLICGLGEKAGPVQATIRWPGGFQQDVDLIRRQITTVHDETEPTVQNHTIKWKSHFYPNTGRVDWIFTWETSYSCNPELDEVKIEYASGHPGNCYMPTTYLRPGMYGVEASVTAKVGGGYLHIMKWLSLDCVPNCGYEYTVKSATNRHESTGQTKLFTIRFCPSSGG